MTDLHIIILASLILGCAILVPLKIRDYRIVWDYHYKRYLLTERIDLSDAKNTLKSYSWWRKLRTDPTEEARRDLEVLTDD